ncbi:MAG: glycosyltransferase family 2 protein [Lentisphaeria bacterium]|nr:glycosyltransferase family 2 protein [Lentisphaeria bacterium]
MQTNYAISIIVPVYNVEPYLPRCLDSIINQTYKNIEIIIVDDGSTDNSGKICDAYTAKDPRIKVIHQENQGLSAARNTGLKLVSNEWITFVDSDDFISQDCISKIINILHNHNDIDMIMWGVQGFIENDTFSYIDLPYFQKSISHKQTKLTPHLKKHIPVIACNKLYKTAIIKGQKLQFTTGFIHEDNIFYWQYISFCKNFFCISDKLYYYRQARQNSITNIQNSSSDTHAFDAVLGSKIIYDFWEKNNLWKENKALFPRILSGMLKKSAKRTPASQKKELTNKAKNIVRQIDISFIGKLKMYYAIFHYCK